MSRLTKVLMLCVDAGDTELIRRWSEAGELPTFRSLLATGCSMPVESPAGLYGGALWPSFYGGVSPARHGRYSPEQLAKGTYRVELFPDEDAKAMPFWNAIAEAGLRVAVIDVPKAPLSMHENVTQVSNWGTADKDPACLRSRPDLLAMDLVARFGVDPVGLSDAYHGAAEMAPLRDRLLERVAKTEAILAHLLRQGGWDLFLGAFASAHCVGHMMWHLHDSSHPKYDPLLAAELGDPLLQIYRAIDASVGRLIDMAGKDVLVLLYSSTGMGPRYTGNHLLGEVLRRLETAPPSTWRAYRRSLRQIRFLLPWRFLPSQLRTPGRALARALEESSRVGERRHRLAFQVPTNEHASAVRVNLRGREPKGRIAPGAEYQAFCEILTADLLDLVNLDTGKPAVRAVLQTDREYPGERLDDLPDLLVIWNREAPIEGLGSSKVGEVRGVLPGFRTGDHTREAILIARGPGIESGQSTTAISLVDIAPTVAAAVGVSLNDVDGRPAPKLAGLMPVSQAV